MLCMRARQGIVRETGLQWVQWGSVLGRRDAKRQGRVVESGSGAGRSAVTSYQPAGHQVLPMTLRIIWVRKLWDDADFPCH